ncbi:hypothetical protein [Nocardioides convexus]|uniref:hypothetical protein n=1 Tax=Nocardioides convexus TaxID=2712224 RepID=UPI0024185907|nr:hypothetical protein [Nocardioides convexus]
MALGPDGARLRGALRRRLHRDRRLVGLHPGGALPDQLPDPALRPGDGHRPEQPAGRGHRRARERQVLPLGRLRLRADDVRPRLRRLLHHR